jgi:Rrf2 family transcriptional regulator, cysteine metabolism repressor
MKHSAKTVYAAMAVLELARRWGTGEPVRMREISASHGVPARFLVQILLQLKAAGLVTSTRGAGGGYQLALAPDAISLEDIVRIFEPDEPATTGSDRSRGVVTLRTAWAEAAEAEATALRSLTFAELLDRARLPSGAMYYI